MAAWYQRIQKSSTRPKDYVHDVPYTARSWLLNGTHTVQTLSIFASCSSTTLDTATLRPSQFGIAHKYLPTGRTHIGLQLKFDGDTWVQVVNDGLRKLGASSCSHTAHAHF